MDRSRMLVSVIALVGALAACRGPNESPTTTTGAPSVESAPAATSASVAAAPSASTPSAPQDPLARADAAVTSFATTLRRKLDDAMTDGGQPRAIEVCATEAPAIAKKVHEETGVRVGRSSLRLRNPADAPPPWVAEWLKSQGERKAEGVAGVKAIVDTGSGKVARVIRPIAVNKLCLSCHGDAANVAPSTKAALAAKYPKDAATGYHEGDLRGAFWAELPVDR